jgi:para-aminobenzoate synthetase/4-amino-4-deoxychorismate lyase
VRQNVAFVGCAAQGFPQNREMTALSAPLSPTESFVLFDDAHASAQQPSSRLLRGVVSHHCARTQQQVLPVFAELDCALARGRQAAVFVAYEAAQALAGLPVKPTAETDAPLVELLTFDHAAPLSAQQVQTWLDAQIAALPAGAAQPCGVAGLQANVTQAEYAQAIARIGAHLRAGESYQINYTFALRGWAYGHPLALYAALRRAQPTRYACLARLAGRWVLSLSPELFFSRDGDVLRAQPMKGTAPRLPDPQADALAAQQLAADAKNRAENLMILDLLRNDLGRLAVPGSVRVPARFAVEAYPTVWQMTSSIEARLDPARGAPGWAGLFAALFPCGSVTGAPKRMSMDIIRRIESEPRGLYTGAIGYVAPDGAAARAVFNVAIRTLQIDAAPQTQGEAAGMRALRIGVGSGVVIDSSAEAEWQECWDKLRFVTGHDPGFGLIETFAALWPAQAERVERHLARLARSAAFFGFGCDLGAIRDAVARAHSGLPAAAPQPPAADDAWSKACAALAPAPWRTRLVLRKSGDFELDVQAMPSAPPQPVRLLLSADALDPLDPFLRHKTTHRARYDAAWRAAEAQGAFDQLFCNTRGELCEGARSTVLLRLDGAWWTPPLVSGLLPGVARQWLIDAGVCAERVLRPADLQRAQNIAVVNSVRGVLAAVV